MKKSVPYIILFLVVAAVIVLLFTGNKDQKDFDQRITLRKRDKIPYGTNVAYQSLTYIFPNASVSVQVQKFRPFYILGEVQRPGQYPYIPGMTVLTAVSIAGGYTFRANKNDTELVRTRKRVSSRARAGTDAQVLPGDTLMVPEAWF